MSPVALGQTIAVVDKSGKVISTSKTLLAVFKEAKAAYRERKAEIVAERQLELETKQAQRALKQFTFDERSAVVPSSEDGRKSKSRSRSKRTTTTTTNRVPTEARHRRVDDLSTVREEGAASSRRRPDGVTRRHTSLVQDDHVVTRREGPTRSASYPGPSDIDMDLAYGELPPPSPTPADETELKGLMTKVTMLLDEAHCVQHSVTATITALQKDPDALAAVALTLAEISNVVAKMAPGALLTMKGSFPAVFALLASPQFMIAAGVGVGVVVVALGGYKIIKKIRAARNEDEGEDELQELDVDVDRIDAWRRGVSEVETASVCTSVEGEFITPEAAALRRAEGSEPAIRRRDTESEGGSRSRSKKKKSSKSHKGGKSAVGGGDGKREGERKKKSKKPSTLQLLFH
ncbi:MAG: hypothetical protein M1823_000457 [Watsoniomyces obsoletus]|nr:MAG: hypothetical protein M1823_000457 [Watsoniomyces obsoletus]